MRPKGISWAGPRQIYNILVLKKGGKKDHLDKMELTIYRLKENGLKCNIENYFFGQTKIKYLGFWMMRKGVRELNKI